MSDKTSYRILLIFIGLFFYSCAQRGVLTGGDKDVTAPQLSHAVPENQSLQFSAKEISIEFDEFIKLKNVSSQLIISPPMTEQPEIHVKGKKLFITINEKLLENTTYSLNFGDAIVDITEDNPFSNFKYIFSTGNFLDSLSFSGKVQHSFDLSPSSNVLVMLYKDLSDSAPLTKKPDYVAKTTNDGSFTISNISGGTYKVFALEDANSNYLFDSPNEKIGFANESIAITESIDSLKINLFTEKDTLQYIKKSGNPMFGKLNIELNIPSQQLEIFNENNTIVPILSQEVDKSATLFTFWINNTKDERTFIIKDSGKVIDTLNVEMILPKDVKDTVLTISNAHSGSLDLNQPIEISVTQPIQTVNTQYFRLSSDSVPVPFTTSIDSLSNQKVRILAKFKENTSYLLTIEPGAIQSVYQLTNDSVKVAVKTKKEKDYGKLLLNVAPNFTEQYVVQLLQKGVAIKEYVGLNEQKIEFPYLQPGEYQLKIIVDNNQNKKWDTGNYRGKIQPEKVIIYNEKILIRANWDNELQWNINF